MHTVAQTLDTGAGAWFRYGELLNSELCISLGSHTCEQDLYPGC